MMRKFVLIFGLLFAAPAFAIGATIAAYLASQGIIAYGFMATVTAFAINVVASSIISKAFFSPADPSGGGLSGDSLNPGNRQQVPPATDNKLPVVYGSSYVGGIVTDMSISTDNQHLYFVIALSEVTSNGADVYTFGDIYFGGKKCIFDSTITYQVNQLYDVSTGISTDVTGNLNIYTYRNGSATPTNSSSSAITVMSASNLTYQWDSNKLMTNCAFAIVHMVYNSNQGLTSLQQTRFQINNPLSAPGACIQDYLTNTVYGGAIPASQINAASIAAIDAYSSTLITYTTATGGTATQKRFEFDGLIDPNQPIMTNVQYMASCCDSLLSYNQILGQWSVIVQQVSYTVAMALDDSNIVSAMTISPIDLAGSYNVIEVKYPDSANQDVFATVTIDLQTNPALLYANEPVNKQTVNLPLVNNNVRAQYVANRMLKAAREDLQVQLDVNFTGIQLEAGDIVTITNVNYGWTAKLFRVNKVTDVFADNGAILSKLSLSEFNPTVWDEYSVTQFVLAPNTGIANPAFFGTVPAPVVAAQYPTNVIPVFTVQVTSSSSGLTQYAEVWYSAYATPTPTQYIFAGTTEIQPAGNPYTVNQALPLVTLSGIPSGDYYIFSRMVNSLATSQFSSASSVLHWRPRTFQYANRYLIIAYADNSTGTSNFNFNPRNRLYYGLANQTTTTPSSVPSDYSWYLADPAFGTTIYLLYSNWTGRRFSFATSFAGYAVSGAFVPTLATTYDPTRWAAVPDGTNSIDLDMSTGYLISSGGTSTTTGELSVSNSADGKITASLARILDFGAGIDQFTSSGALLTVDVYGRVVGFTAPDAFYWTKTSFTATSGQTIFSVTRGTGYITGQCFVFQNGVLLDISEYTDATGSVTLTVGATVGDTITIISMRSYNATSGYYASFTRNSATVTNISSYTPSPAITSGYELLFINGTILNDQDYDFVGTDIGNFPSNMTGLFTWIEWSANNLGLPNGNPANVIAYTTIGQSTYAFSYDASAFDLFSNGIQLLQGTDFTTSTGTYSLSNTPTTTTNVMVQQIFARTGAA